jgi:hypothetical protein
LIILSVLESKQSFSVLLEVLKQDEDFLEFWYSDFLPEEMWRFIYSLGGDQLPLLSDFIKDPQVNLYAKTAVSTTMLQIALNQKERKPEVINWYRNLFNYYLASEDISDDNYEFVGHLISDVIDFGGKELEDEIIKLYENNLGAHWIAGNLKTVLEDLNDFDPYLVKNEIFTTCDQWYEYFLSILNHDEESNSSRDKYWDQFFVDSYRHEIINPPVVAGHKYQRNDPCHCGSGLKYKKCHGK